MSELKSCGVLIVRGDPLREFLLMKHTDRWDLPKGHVDAGETELECALRELMEETGIQATDIRLNSDFRFEHRYTVTGPRTNHEPAEKTLVIFLGHLLNDVSIVVTEHKSSSWFKWDPPHHIQQRTIDPLLEHLDHHLNRMQDTET